MSSQPNFGPLLVGTFLTSFTTFAAGLLLATRAAGALGYRFVMGRGASARVQ
jgi:hypothetical protein